MLIKCPECKNDISDKAIACPKCGYVLSMKSAKKIYKAKRLRLPNGFGRITKITNKNLRKPYRAMVTVGTDSNGKPVGKILKPEGYFATYNDAYKALMDYQRKPYDFADLLTVEDVFNKWYEEHVTNTSKSHANLIKSAWNYCLPIKNEEIRYVKPSQLKFILDNGSRIDSKGKEVPIPLNMKANVKALFLGVFGYALERDLVDRNIAKDISVGKDAEKKIRAARKPHTNYTDDELKILWDNENNLFVAAILIQCYSGWRPGELFDMELSNVDLDNWTMTGGNKTDNGKNRMVPIHSKIRHLVKRSFELAKKNRLKRLIVIEKTGKIINPLGRTMMRRMESELLPEGVSRDHRWHDGRVTFVSLAKKYGVDEYAIKRLVGHSIDDITEKIYTVRDFEWLRSEIEKII